MAQHEAVAEQLPDIQAVDLVLRPPVGATVTFAYSDEAKGLFSVNAHCTPCEFGPAGTYAVGANNRAQWCYQPYEDLIQEAKTTFAQNERQPLYFKAQEVFKEQAPWATIAHSVATVPMRATVTGFAQDPVGIHRFVGVDKAE